MEIVLATRNKKKLDEIRRMSVGLSLTFLPLDAFPTCPEVAEDQNTFEGNAVKKATEVCLCTGKPALADDSGLVVDALGGAPGVFSARYAGSCLGRESDAANNTKLLAALGALPDEKRGAQFVCCMALAFPDSSIRLFRATAAGRIGHELRGTRGFGYDPLFIPQGHARTFGEMSAEEKDALSHRGKALRELAGFLRVYAALSPA